MKFLFMSMFSLLTLLLSDCDQAGSQVASIAPCFTDREALEELKQVALSCRRAGDLIVLGAENGDRFAVCNSDNLTFETGKTYVINGIVYPAKANERWPGAPLEITTMK